MAVIVEQLTLFPLKPVCRKPRLTRKSTPTPKLRGQFLPVAPPDLSQESGLWLVGQRSIAEQRGRRYVPASVKHPGKMWPDLAGAIIDTYTAPGDWILDPMGGIGTTGVEGAERGRHVICFELVRHWANVAYANAVRTAYRGAPGSMRVIQGDARRLPAMLAGMVDLVALSPPYGEALKARTHRIEGRIERLKRLIAEGGLDPDKLPSWACNQEYSLRWRAGHVAAVAPSYDADRDRHYVDAAVFSPPFGDSRIAPIPSGVVYRSDGEGLEVGNLPRGYDVVLTSPPYGPSQEGRGLALTGFSDDPRPLLDRCGARYYDAVVTSPAYGDIRQDGGAHQFGDGSAMTNYTGEDRIKRSGRDRTNIGNLKYGQMEKALALVARLKEGVQVPESEWSGMQYLESMALVYWGCLQVLKASGLCILVLKDYRRDKQRVDLIGDTTTLMKAIGFKYHDRALAVTGDIREGKVVSRVSPFVRVNARRPGRNGGHVLLPPGEEVLVFRKE